MHLDRIARTVPFALRAAAAGLAPYVAVALGLPLVQCADGITPDQPATFACKCPADKPCPTEVCDVQIEISQKTCAGKVAKVEVLIGDKLDPEPVTFGTPRRTCATIGRGQVQKLHVRSDTTWQWIEDLACPPAGPSDTQGVTVVRVLNCTTSTSP